MNKNLYPLAGSPTRGLVRVVGAFVVGAAGAVGAITDEGGAIASIVRDSAGVYIVTLEDRVQFQRLAGAVFTITGAAASDHTFKVEAVDGEAGTIQFRVLAAAVETDPTNGDTLAFIFELVSVVQGARA